MAKQKQIVLFIDTETTGLSPSKDEVIQVGCILSEYCQETHNTIDMATINIEINPKCEEIAEGASSVHGKTKETLKDKKVFKDYANFLYSMMLIPDIIVGHNISYDIGMICGEFARLGLSEKKIKKIKDKDIQCTMKKRSAIHGGKRPKLSVLHQELFNEDFEGVHDAMADIKATKRIWVKMKEDDLI